MAQAITNKKSKMKKIRRSDYPYTVAQAAANGDIATRISFLILGFGSIVRKQFVKGFSYLVLEVLFICDKARSITPGGSLPSGWSGTAEGLE